MEKRPSQDNDQEHDPSSSHNSKGHGSNSNIPIKPTQHFHMPPKPASAHGKHSNTEFSPVKWDHFYDEMFYLEDGTSVFKAGHTGAIFFCIHGAGQSAQSFALLAKQVSKFATIICYDIQGHGCSKRAENTDSLTIETLLEQATAVLKEIMRRYPEPNFVIAGHSLGGSIACRLTEAAPHCDWGKRIQGMIIIDIVEGTAIEALPFMTNILDNRPKTFKSQDAAIQWSVQSNNLRRAESARVSIPPQLSKVVVNAEEHRFEWKINLKETEKFWLGWFQGLSGSFLRVKLPKILITAEKERLDKELTIAQMQGKFKVSIVHNVGHSVQEDDYHQTARLFHEFLFLFRIPQNVHEQQIREHVGLAKFHPELKPYS